MAQGISIQIYGDDSGVQKMLQAVDTALSPVALVAFMGGVVEPWVKRRASQRFSSEGDDVTGPWLPLESTTQSIRASQGYGAAHPINVRTGELERYITGSNGIKASTGLETSLTYPGAAPVGELANKVKVAQSGGSQPGHKPTPARPVLGLNEQDMAFVLLALTKHVSTVAASRGVTMGSSGIK